MIFQSSKYSIVLCLYKRSAEINPPNMFFFKVEGITKATLKNMQHILSMTFLVTSSVSNHENYIDSGSGLGVDAQ